MVRVLDLNDKEPAQPAPGVNRWVVAGTGCMFVLVEATSGTEIPEHQHAEEQMTYVLKGKLRVHLDGGAEQVVLTSGMLISYGVDECHGVTVVEDTTVVELFQPPMQPYMHDAL